VRLPLTTASGSLSPKDEWFLHGDHGRPGRRDPS
jgi:hypothetical protein